MAKAHRIRRPPTSKPGSARDTRGPAPQPYTSSSRLDFLVVKVDGGAPLRPGDLEQLTRGDLEGLARHIKWRRDFSNVAQDTETTKHNLELVEAAIEAFPKSSAGSVGWDITNAMLKYAAPDFLAQMQTASVAGQIADITNHEVDRSGAKEWEHRVTPSASKGAAGPARDAEVEIEGRARSLYGGEAAIIARYFPPWFESEALSIAPTARARSWVRADQSRMHLTRRHFEGRNWRNPIANDHRWIRTLVHEAFHVLYHSLEGAPLVHDYPKEVMDQRYKFARGIGDSSIIGHFLNLNHESQAEMFAEGAAAAEVTTHAPAEPLGADETASLNEIAKQLAPVVEYIRRLPPDATYWDLLHADQFRSPDFRTADPVARADPRTCELFDNC